MPTLDSKAAGLVADLAEDLGLRAPTPEDLAAFEAELATAPRHCEDYLDDPTQPECLRRFLDYQCRPAALKYPTRDEAFNRGMEEHLGQPMWRDPVPALFARHEGRPVRVTLASRLGDVGISEDLDAEWGYGKRVAIEDLTDFSDERPCAWSERVYTNGPARAVVVDGSWGGGFMGNPGNRAASASHNRMLAEISAPEIRRFEGNRAERRAAASRARRLRGEKAQPQQAPAPRPLDPRGPVTIARGAPGFSQTK